MSDHQQRAYTDAVSDDLHAIRLQPSGSILCDVGYSGTTEGDVANARRITAMWNVCRGLDTAHLENIDMVGDTLKDRFMGLQEELRLVPLAKKHTGMMVDYSGMLRQTINALPRSSSFQAEMLRQFQAHLEELATRYYAGDTSAVDEFLQLYCIGGESRKHVVVEQGVES